MAKAIITIQCNLLLTLSEHACAHSTLLRLIQFLYKIDT